MIVFVFFLYKYVDRKPSHMIYFVYKLKTVNVLKIDAMALA